MNENEIEGSMPRAMRTPISEAGSVLNVAWEFWIEMFGRVMAKNPERDYGELADPKSYFANEIFSEAWNDPATNGDKLVEEITLSLDGKGDLESVPFALQAMGIIVAYAVQAMKAGKGDNRDEAWTYVVNANFWAGILRGTSNPAAELARLRHAEHYALAAYALKYWKENIDPSISASKAANILVVSHAGTSG